MTAVIDMSASTGNISGEEAHSELKLPANIYEAGKVLTLGR